MPFHPGFKGRAPRLLTLSYVGAVLNTVDENPQSLASVAIGTAAADRHIVAVWQTEAVNGPFQAGVIGGITATRIVQIRHASKDEVDIYLAKVPTGTTATMTFTTSGGNAPGGLVAVYAIYGDDALAVHDTATLQSAGATSGITLDVLRGGVAIAAVTRDSNSTGVVFSGIAGTERYDTLNLSSFNAAGCGATTSATAVGQAINFTGGASSNFAIGGVSF